MAVVTSHGTEIYYEAWGEGTETLIFAHGMGGNAAIWYHQIAAFSPRYRTIAFDHRYFGRSGCAVEDFRPALFADDLLAIMEAENIATAVLICQSMGGWTGSQMVLRHPERVRGLVMSHTPGVFYHPNVVNDPAAVADLVSQPRGQFGSAALAHDFPGKNPPGAVLYSMISSFNNIDPAVIPRAIGQAGLGVNTETLTDYATPTLFVTGDLDVLFPAEYIASLAATLPGARCVNLGAVGHSSYFETPSAFNDTLAAFLEEIASG
ncbi:MAG: alpha/beta hydrolase [Pseudomonadales bacterium]|nr:alpha/beta hydrolase [Pseudomonadales bacterium]